MRTYLAYGGGVNSTALLLMGGYDEAVFVNHGGDWPETYEYVSRLRNMARIPITVLIPYVEGCTTIEQYSLKHGIIPLRQMRWCTDKFKIRVMNRYFERPCKVMIGYSFEERRRAIGARPVKGITFTYPLIEKQITRRGCKEIIRRYAYRVPMRSGCWFCPFQRWSQFKTLLAKHPDLLLRAAEMEKAARTTIKSKPLTRLLGNHTLDCFQTPISPQRRAGDG